MDGDYGGGAAGVDDFVFAVCRGLGESGRRQLDDYDEVIMG